MSKELRDAAMCGDDAVVFDLLTHGLNVDAATDDGWTALMFAARNGRTSTVRMLLDFGARIDLRCQKGNDALDRAINGAFNNSDAECVRLIVQQMLRSSWDILEVGRRCRDLMDWPLLRDGQALRKLLEHHGYRVVDLTLAESTEIVSRLKRRETVFCTMCGEPLMNEFTGGERSYCPQMCTYYHRKHALIRALRSSDPMPVRDV